MRISTPLLVVILILGVLVQAYSIFGANTKSKKQHKILVLDMEKGAGHDYREIRLGEIQGYRKPAGIRSLTKWRVWEINRKKVSICTISGTPPPKSGNWTISDVTIVEGETLIINGSIIVNTSGTLILKNTAIYMNLTYDGEHWIDVYGNLTVLNLSLIHI